MSDSMSGKQALMRYGSLVAGPLLCLIIFLAMPSSYVTADGSVADFSQAGRACLGVLVWMAIWWCFETAPIAVTSLLPMVLFPLLGVCKPAAAMAPYASDTIFLFMGAFILAAGVTKWGLDRRIALFVMSCIGATPKKIVFGIMLTTGTLSAFMSNTACAAMMVPVAIALVNLVHSTNDPNDKEAAAREHRFTICLLLALAYSASIGGMATLIGSPPNGIYMRFMEQTYGTSVSIVDWMKVGVPVAVMMFLVAYFVLANIMFRDMGGEVPGGREWVKKELAGMGKMSRGEIAIGLCFLIAAVLWFTGSAIRGIEVDGCRPFRFLNDAVIAMMMGVISFLIPTVRRRSFACSGHSEYGCCGSDRRAGHGSFGSSLLGSPLRRRDPCNLCNGRDIEHGFSGDDDAAIGSCVLGPEPSGSARALCNGPCGFGSLYFADFHTA